MSTVAFVFARGGSKGLPGKNISDFGGKPLIAWSIECALSVKGIDQVIVSTDSEEIAEISQKYGAEVPFMRPPELATDESPEWLSWRHALDYMRHSSGSLPEVMVSLPATSPLRVVSDVESCLDEFSKGACDVVVTVTEAHRNPYFNMVKEKSDGTVALVIEDFQVSRRQDAPIISDLATVCYVANPGFVLSHNSIFEGRVKAVNVPKERAIDIDSLLDFEIAE
ncbi:MAG: cytidylyltransferase domain-containing protein, partial [Deltaproteobacteria bacterium]